VGSIPTCSNFVAQPGSPVGPRFGIFVARVPSTAQHIVAGYPGHCQSRSEKHTRYNTLIIIIELSYMTCLSLSMSMLFTHNILSFHCLHTTNSVINAVTALRNVTCPHRCALV